MVWVCSNFLPMCIVSSLPKNVGRVYQGPYVNSQQTSESLAPNSLQGQGKGPAGLVHVLAADIITKRATSSSTNGASSSTKALPHSPWGSALLELQHQQRQRKGGSPLERKNVPRTAPF